MIRVVQELYPQKPQHCQPHCQWPTKLQLDSLFSLMILLTLFPLIDSVDCHFGFLEYGQIAQCHYLAKGM